MLTPAEAMNGMAARAANTIAAKMRFPVFFICGPILPSGLQQAMPTYQVSQSLSSRLLVSQPHRHCWAVTRHRFDLLELGLGVNLGLPKAPISSSTGSFRTPNQSGLPTTLIALKTSMLRYVSSITIAPHRNNSVNV